MSDIYSTKIVTDKMEITIQKSQITEDNMSTASFVRTQKHYVASSDGMKWWIEYHPRGVSRNCASRVFGGQTENAMRYLSLFLYLNKPVLATLCVRLPGKEFTVTDRYDMKTLYGMGWHKLIAHEDLLPMMQNDELTIECMVELTVPVPLASLTPRLFESCGHVPTDVLLVTEAGSVSAHKGLLMLISPVFNAMFTHSTAEAKSSVVNITDFDYDTIEVAINFSYGRELPSLSIKNVIKILRFADKYDLKSILTQLDPVPLANLSTKAFHCIASYAFDCSKAELFADCCKFLKRNELTIIKTEEFGKLHPSVIIELIKNAFARKSAVGVLRYADQHGISSVQDYLESSLMSWMHVNNFCDVSDYVWERKREDLKKTCFDFWNGNRKDVMALPGYSRLSDQVVADFLKL